MAQQLQALFLPFLACLILTGIHVYLGIHVISRKVIFVDIALAQIAALGATVAFLLGHDPRSEGAYYISLGFAILAAVIFALTRTKNERVPQEAIIGLTYATASAAAILLADISPHGAEHLHDLLAGSIVWVTPGQIIKTAVLYALLGLFHFIFRRRFLLISLHPEEAYAQGIRVRLWDFLFYLSFGVVITSAVQIAGVLLVFCYLVAPSVFAVMFYDDLKRRLLTGWTMATAVSAIGLFFSYDRPSGPTIMVTFAIALILGGTIKAIATAPSRSRALTVATASLVIASGAAWMLYTFRPLGGASPEEVARGFGQEALGGTTAVPAPGADPTGSAPPGGSAGAPAALSAPEHPVGNSMQELRRALKDTHENVRVAAVRDIASTADPRILPDLIEALHDQSAAVREQAAAALARLGNRAALPALQQALKNKDEDEWVRLRIAQALAGLGAIDGIPVLLDLARNADAGMTRLEGMGTLARLAGIRDPVPSDPDSPEASAYLKALERFWTVDAGRLHYDEASRTYR
ncbi:MAG TPA: iron chelate uptake ABC transporter family permease subunit [Candidatus Polarisedimenticolia bacterium]|nr:iron chelate uptake ABC transporter family permease subunit [Candidatus Polarisedimenticolia bacterium]